MCVCACANYFQICIKSAAKEASSKTIILLSVCHPKGEKELAWSENKRNSFSINPSLF